MFPIRRLAAVPAALMCALILAGSAVAVPPERNVIDVDETFPLPEFLCGFPITQHLEGTFRQTTFFNQDGEPVRILETVSRWRITLANPATGASVTTVGSASNHVTLHADGSATVMVTGLQGRVMTPDGLVADVGRLVISFPADGPPTLISVSGLFSDGPFPEVCALLA